MEELALIYGVLVFMAAVVTWMATQPPYQH
jgi:hypothetical protein